MKLKKLKLNVLSEENLQDKTMNVLKGGNCCTCSCYWEGSGGSSSGDNQQANYRQDTTSVHGCNQYTACDEWPLDFDPEDARA